MPHKNDKRLALCLALNIICVPLLLHAATDEASVSIIKFQQTLAAKGQPAAQYKLAMIYETGDGVEPNITASRIWYSRAAEQSYKPAAHRLKYLDMLQNKNRADPHWLSQLQSDADQGDGEVRLLLGQMYANAAGLDTDLKLATHYLRLARAQNVPGADSDLAHVDARLRQQVEQQNQSAQRAAIAANQAKLKSDQAAAERQRIASIQQQKKQTQAQQLRQQRLLEQQQRLVTVTSSSPSKPAALVDRKISNLPTPPGAALEDTAASPCDGRNRFAPTCR